MSMKKFIDSISLEQLYMKPSLLKNVTRLAKKRLRDTGLAICLLTALHINASDIHININCPPNRLIGPQANNNNPVEPFLAATITSDHPDHIIELLEISIKQSKPIIWQSDLPKIWVWNRSNPNYKNFAMPASTGMNASLHIAPNNTNAQTYDVFVQFAYYEDQAHCERLWLEFKTTFLNDLTTSSHDYQYNTVNGTGICNFFFSRYTDNWNVYTSSDLFVKDDKYDRGSEPYYGARNDASTSLLNTLNQPAQYRNSYGINPELNFPNAAKRSTLGNYNFMNVLVETRGCAATQNPAQIELFWTVNRTFEPWSKDWFNYQSHSFAANNYVDYTDANGNTNRYPAGNQITIADKNDYASPNAPVYIPAGILPTKTDNNLNSYGGFLTSVQWNPPHPDWFKQSFANFHWHTPIEPVLCYLAVITEPSQPQDGFALPLPRATANAHVSDYTIHNNNVAQVNSYLATPDNRYKNKAPGTKYRSNTAAVIVNNPDNRPAVNLKFKKNTDDLHNFAENGAVYLVFDDFLWAKWMANGAIGNGFEIVSDYVLRITDYNMATIDNMQLSADEEGMIGIMFEYDGLNVPESDYYYGLTMGAYDSDGENMTGNTTHFNTLVMHEPQAPDEGSEDEAYRATGISSGELAADFISTYPNPVTEQLNISYHLKNDSRFTSIELYDINGKKVQAVEYPNLKQGGQKHTFDMTGLVPGNYLIKLSVDGNYRTFKAAK